MMSEPKRGKEAAARLLQSLEPPDDLSCEEAQRLLPALVEAEHAGEDVDALPQYATLLRHLDRCETCIEIYRQLVEDLEALLGAADTLPLAHPAPPTFFPVKRQSDRVQLRVFQGLKRGFDLTISRLRLGPTIPVLGDQATLFSDRLAEVDGTPIVVVSLDTAGQTHGVLQVAVRDSARTRWRVRVIVGETVRTADTDERGIARFEEFAAAELHELTLSCTELATDTKSG